MRTFVGNEFGRIVVMNLERGEKLIESIKAEVDRLGIKNAVLLTCIGSLLKTELHVVTVTDEKSLDKYISLDCAIELSSMQGIVVDGQPHFHMVVSDQDKQTYTGHLEPGCVVLYLAEIVLAEIKDLNLCRKLNANGIGMLALKD